MRGLVTVTSTSQPHRRCISSPYLLEPWPKQSLESAIYAVGPFTDHELAIARIVDRINMEGRLDPSVVDEIIAALGFIPSGAENDFLVRYVQWRTANRIVK